MQPIEWIAFLIIMSVGLAPVGTMIYLLHFDLNGKNQPKSKLGKYLSRTGNYLPNPVAMSTLWCISYILLAVGAFLLFVRFNNQTTSYGVSNAFLGLYLGHIVLAWFWTASVNIGMSLWTILFAFALLGTVISLVVLAAVGNAWITFAFTMPLALLLCYVTLLG